MKFHIEQLGAVENTQDIARQRASQGAEHGTVIFATHMSEGRGTHERSWHAPEGGVYLSIVLRDLHSPQLVTLALGNAVADVVELTGIDAQIKWVNDVQIAGKKVAGILVEGEATGAEFDFLIAGIGLNANGDATKWPHPLNASATTLETATGIEQCLEDLQDALLEQVSHWVGLLQDGRGADVVAAWQQRDALFGANVGFDPDGDFCTKLVGIARGITPEGHLRIATEDGEQIFQSGRVFLS